MNEQLRKLKEKLAKEYGEESVMFASEIPQYELVTSGSLALDYAIGGGIPNNRVMEIAGPEGGGKTTLALLIMKNFLLKYPERSAAILDLEHRLTSSWMNKLVGPELMKRILVGSPDSAEESTDLYTSILKSGTVSVVVYDSVGGAPSQRVIKKSAEVGDVGGNALAITRLAKFAAIHSAKQKVATIFINQQRDDMSGYNRFITPGGRGLKHACSLRIKLQGSTRDKIFEKVGTEELQIGYAVRAQVIKNSVAPPFRECYYWFYNVETEKYGFGIDQLEELIRLGTVSGVIDQRGKGWFYHPALPVDSAGDRKVHGLPTLQNVIRENEDVRDTIVAEIRMKLDNHEVDPPVTSFDPDDVDDEPLDPHFFTDLEVEE